jgi:hypothetical protein
MLAPTARLSRPFRPFSFIHIQPRPTCLALRLAFDLGYTETRPFGDPALRALCESTMQLSLTRMGTGTGTFLPLPNPFGPKKDCSFTRLFLSLVL